MLVKEIPAVRHLILIQFTTELEMAEPSCVLLGCHLWVALRIVDVLPGAECCARRGSYKSHVLFFSFFGPSAVVHLFFIKISVSAFTVIRCEVKGKSWKNPVAGAKLGYC